MSGFIATVPFLSQASFMKNISNLNHRFWNVGGLLTADFILFGLTNAQKVDPLWLAAGYVALILTAFQLARLAFKNRRVAAWLTGTVGVMAALQSMGGLSARDWVVILPLVALGYIYSAYLAKAV
jgi:hypothetical protein